MDFFKRPLIVLVLALAFAAGAAFGDEPPSVVYTYDGAPVLGEHVDGEVMVLLEAPAAAVYATGAALEAALISSGQSVAESIGATAVQTYSAIAADNGRNIVYMKSEGKSTEELLTALSGKPGVVGAAPNYIMRALDTTPNDPRYGELWGMKAINAPNAWDTSTGKASVIVAVIDTGIDYKHEDLKDNIEVDADSNQGFNAIANDNDPMDDEGHGTHVAGTIGAVGSNDIGVTGVCWKVGLLGVKVLDNKGYGTGNTIIAGLEYVKQQKNKGLNVRVANMSLGGWMRPIKNPETDPYGAAFKALSDAGVVMVFAAGNEFQNIDRPGGRDSDPHNPGTSYKGKLAYPACFRFENTITVAAMDEDRTRSEFSNYSKYYVDLAAPGGGILSTIPDYKYGKASGTSMAAPHVAGAAALLAAAHPGETEGQIRARILRGVAPNQNFKDKVAFDGHLNLAAAMEGAAPAPVPPILPPDPPEPTPPEPTPPEKRVTGVSLSDAELSLKLAMSGNLTAYVMPEDATDKTVTFSSSNPRVAECSHAPEEQTAVIIGRTEGTAVITVTTNDGGYTDDCVVTVRDISDSGSGCSTGASGGAAAALAMLVLPVVLLLRRATDR
ncbi:MAG: S8 family serine peptidase [Synergistaceae bacterium]|nr:S8 family serine peptidase [Synergistota bacterium]NLM72258.1 S8 family serine peptidase [Synergistaceae bacterium]